MKQDEQYVKEIKKMLAQAVPPSPTSPSPDLIYEVVTKAGLVMVTEADFDSMADAYVLQEVRYGHATEVE